MNEPTKAKTGRFEDFNELEQAAICLAAVVAMQGGRIIITSKELNPEIGDGVVDIRYLQNGDVKVEILKPGEHRKRLWDYDR